MVKQHLQEELVQLTKELIRIPSTHSRPREVGRCAEFIEQWLARYDIPCQRHNSNDIPSLTVMPENGHAPVLLMSHFDVVEVDDESQFEPRLDSGNLYGRGSIDDKYAVALSLILYREHRRKLEEQGVPAETMPLGLLFTGDEEVGGENGAAVLAHRLSTDFFLAVDGGRPGLIVTKEKGIIQLELNAHGVAAHAARPWLGKNAFDILIDDYRRMQEYFLKNTEDQWHKTMVLSKCMAGNGSSNIVPEKATAHFDIRYTEEDNPEALIAGIRRAIQSDLTVHALEPVFVGTPSPYLDTLVEHSDGARVGFEHGASDARYMSQLGVPGAIWGADGEMSQHRGDEHIVLKSFFSMYEKLERFLHHVQWGRGTQ